MDDSHQTKQWLTLKKLYTVHSSWLLLQPLYTILTGNIVPLKLWSYSYYKYGKLLSGDMKASEGRLPTNTLLSNSPRDNKLDHFIQYN